MNVVKFGSKIAVCALSLSVASVAMAQNVRTKPAPARTVQPEVRKAAPSVNSAVNAAPKVESLEAFKQRVGSGAAAATTQQQETGLSCSLNQFADAVSSGTSVSPADAQRLVESHLITRGNCGGPEGVAGYDVQARDNFLVAASSVSKTINGRDANEVSSAELDMAWAKGLAEAKNSKLESGSQAVTVESQIAVARQLRDSCGLRK